MTGRRGQVAAYRALTRLYPATFRHEYREDLVAVFERQLVDDGALRSWCRAIRDLAVTVPTFHLEERMSRRRPTRVPLIFATLAVASLLAALVVGSSGLLFLVVTAASAIVAGWSYQADRPVRASEPARAQWKFLVIGGVLVGVAVTLANTIWGGGDVPGAAWSLMFLLFMVGIVLLAAGIVATVANLARRRGRSLPAA